MRAIGSNHVDSEHHLASAPGSELTLRQFAHELNSLLDGSMRCVAMAARDLQHIEIDDDADRDDISDRLRTAQLDMQRMAALLERAMSSASHDLDIFDAQQPLGEHVQHILDMLQPLAQECGVRMNAELTPRAAKLPSTTLGPVILNALRNAIEACAAGSSIDKRVDLSIALCPAGQLQIVVSDTGPGVPEDLASASSAKPGGHGIGLNLVRSIVADQGGEFRLTNIPYGGGAVMQISIPMRRLNGHGR
jgi:signal transduction histidine kinase